MQMADIASVVTAVPPYRLTTEQLRDAIAAQIVCRDGLGVPAGSESEVESRFCVVPLCQSSARSSTREADGHRAIVRLAANAARGALQEASIGADAVGAVISVTTTALDTPSLDVHLVEELQVRRDCYRIPLAQMGCPGGIAGLRLATDLLPSLGGRSVLVVCAEAPSLHLPAGEWSRDDYQATFTYGDAAAAVVVSASSASPVEIELVKSFLLASPVGPSSARVTRSGLRSMAGSSFVHRSIRQHLRSAVVQSLAAAELSLRDISSWAIPPRSRPMLREIMTSLELSESQVADSVRVWRNCGNTISAGVFLCFAELLATGRPFDSRTGLLSVGAGGACELAVIRMRGDFRSFRATGC